VVVSSRGTENKRMIIAELDEYIGLQMYTHFFLVKKFSIYNIHVYGKSCILVGEIIVK
jgi:hypothetical protein